MLRLYRLACVAAKMPIDKYWRRCAATIALPSAVAVSLLGGIAEVSRLAGRRRQTKYRRMLIASRHAATYERHICRPRRYRHFRPAQRRSRDDTPPRSHIHGILLMKACATLPKVWPSSGAPCRHYAPRDNEMTAAARRLAIYPTSVAAISTTRATRAVVSRVIMLCTAAIDNPLHDAIELSVMRRRRS